MSRTLRLYQGLWAPVLLLVCGYSQQLVADQLVARTVGTVDHAVFQLDIENTQETGAPPYVHSNRHKEKHPGVSMFRSLRILCVQGCERKLSFQEKLIDTPISAFRLWDGSSDFVTTWASGSAYWVRIYHVDRAHVTKVFEQASKTAPQFGVSPDGSLTVVVDNPDSGTVSNTYCMHGSIWKWDGAKYVQYSHDH